MEVLQRVLLLCATWLLAAEAAKYVHLQSFVEADFFSRWTFWSAPDPTHGAVQYVDEAMAKASGLTHATADRVYMGVDMNSVLHGNNVRRSVRIQSRSTYSHGLFILNLDHMPTGCGAWPSFWMYGEDEKHPWPAWGEFDIIEGVHTSKRVFTTLHTSDHCNQSGGRGPSVEWVRGLQGNSADNCYIHAPNQWENQGCSQRGPNASFGSAFNDAGGGTFAAEWDPMAGHIRTWFWQHGSGPGKHLSDHRLDPDSWGSPYSYFELGPRNCDPRHFANMRLVFDITLCGDLGNPTFSQFCPEAAAHLSCQELVAQHPELLREVYWSIRSLDIFQREDAPSRTPSPFDSNGQRWKIFMFATLLLIATITLYVVVWCKVKRENAYNNNIMALGHSWTDWLMPWMQTGSPSSCCWMPVAVEETTGTRGWQVDELREQRFSRRSPVKGVEGHMQSSASPVSKKSQTESSMSQSTYCGTSSL
mmetsp:Transcript_133490/g.266351  ORF Transcript_133490/g.266351 Transcript_133490/m.266351 type:complete len:475 (+) Transcript_133490:82-1506(+)